MRSFVSVANDIAGRRASSRHQRRAAEAMAKKNRPSIPKAEEDHPAQQAKAEMMSSGFHRLGANARNEVAPKPQPPKVADTLLASNARLSGYTGSMCDICGSTRMRVSGHCAVCEDCGTSTGCS